MNFDDKVESYSTHTNLSVDWDGVIRFKFDTTYSRPFVGTEYADYVMIFWQQTAYGVWNDPYVKMVSYLLLDETRVKTTLKKFYDECDVPRAIAWLAENTL